VTIQLHVKEPDGSSTPHAFELSLTGAHICSPLSLPLSPALCVRLAGLTHERCMRVVHAEFDTFAKSWAQIGQLMEANTVED
jgi:hypothetical protein